MTANFSEKVSFIWSVADLLRGDYKTLEPTTLIAMVVLDGELTGEVVALGFAGRWFPRQLAKNKIQAADYRFRLSWERHKLPGASGGRREMLHALIRAGRLKLLVEAKHYVPSLLDARGSLVAPASQHTMQAKNLARIQLTGHGRPDLARGIDEELDIPEDRRGTVK